MLPFLSTARLLWPRESFGRNGGLRKRVLGFMFPVHQQTVAGYEALDLPGI